MKQWTLSIIFLVLLLPPAFAENLILFPSLEAETLLGKKLKIPEDFHGSTWIVIGFTRNSQKATTVCSTQLEQNFAGRGYSAALLQGAPFFIKGTIKSNIRSSVPDTRKDRYLILNEGMSELEKITGMENKSKDDAFIIGLRPKLNSDYEVSFVSHGDCQVSHFSSLTKIINRFLDQKK